LKDIKLNEISQAQKDKHYRISLNMTYMWNLTKLNSYKRVESWLPESPGEKGRYWGVVDERVEKIG
jgi:hypothetical protein